ncbi:hypothetical protein [Kordiimonas pumila]|uniref:Uncharacterized protein n=1 Tax=Kordiimonas pumila TaxID=2161677 RepID=A0ABV7D549_9PROT|nr:hypothetical protein [Kordiimonas pumila]
MILESRSIIFSDEELVLALRPLIESRGLVADNNVTGVDNKLDTDGEVSVTVTITDKDPVDFSSREVGAAVLNHCIEQGIPLPRGSYKELAIRGNHIALIVRLETGAASPEIDEGDE